jgi:hypothetical protein
MYAFTATTYFWPGEAVSPFRTYISFDCNHWTQVTPTITGGNGNWPTYTYTLNNLSNTNFVRIRWGNNTSAHSWNPQLGQVIIR